MVLFTHKIVTKLPEIWVRDPGSKRDPGFGSETLQDNYQLLHLADLEFKVKLGQHDLQAWRPGGVRLVSPVEVGECLPQVYPPTEANI
jgi:hypothetical protein